MNKAATPKRIATVVLIVTLVRGSMGLADNPIVQTIYTADPAPMVHDGVCYVYTTHDEDVIVRNFFTMNDWRCYCSTDMVNWTDLGSPLSYKDFSWARDNSSWAGHCIPRNGRFYFYVPINRKSGGTAIGVAVANSPAGPFSDPLGKPLLAGAGYIDPAVFIDGDGQAYLYWGNPKLYYVKLNEDMISYSGQVNEVPLTTGSFGVRSKNDRATRYEEGPWLYQRKGLYYMVFAAGPISEHIAYATGPTATGPWTFRDTLMPTQGKSFTNHPGLVDYKGNTYFFYHNGALPDGGGFHRSVCVEQLKFNEDGTNALSIAGFDATTSGLGISAAAGSWASDTNINAAVANLDTALTTLRSEAKTLSSNLNIITTRNTFTQGMINVLTEGATNLTAADTNEEGANMLMLQVRQSLGTTALSLSAQAAQSVLRLF